MVAWDHRDRRPVVQEVLPDPCVNLAIEPAGVLLHGVKSRPSFHELAGTGVVVGTKFRPGGFSGFVPGPAEEAGQADGGGGGDDRLSGAADVTNRRIFPSAALRHAPGSLSWTTIPKPDTDAFTLVELRELEDDASAGGMGDTMEARFARAALGGERIGVSLQRVLPGARQPFGHHHGDDEEIYVVVAGSGRAAVDGQVVELRPWSALRVAPSAVRLFEAGDEGLEFLAFRGTQRERRADRRAHLADHLTSHAPGRPPVSPTCHRAPMSSTR